MRTVERIIMNQAQELGQEIKKQLAKIGIEL